MEIYQLSNTPTGRGAIDRLEKCVASIKATYTDDRLSENDIDTLQGVETKCAAYITLVIGSSADTEDKLAKFDQILSSIEHFCQIVEAELKAAQLEGNAA